jgi:DNA-binding CsgD family transcriptional regulator
VDLLSGLGYQSFLGRALEVLGRSLVDIDRTRAVKALEQAAEIFDNCGARWRRERAIETLRSLRGRGEKAAAALLGPASLTKREREVARLAVQGLTAKEIAKQLILGPRTVEGHLANVYAKLGVRSKVELVRRATELGL